MTRKQIQIGFLAAVAVMLFAAPGVHAILQRPNAPLVAGATSGGQASTLLVDSDGTLHTTQSASTVTVVTPTDGVLVTAFAGTAGMTAITSGYTSNFTTTTTNVQSLWANNQCTSGVRVFLMDGASNYFIGPAYTMAGSANGYLIPPSPVGVRFASGINASADTASCIKIAVTGKQ